MQKTIWNLQFFLDLGLLWNMQKLKGLTDDVCMCCVELIYFFSFHSEFDNWQFWKPKKFRRKYLDGTLEKFDFVFTHVIVRRTFWTRYATCKPYSLSVLCQYVSSGRYGDPLNPWVGWPHGRGWGLVCHNWGGQDGNRCPDYTPTWGHPRIQRSQDLRDTQLSISGDTYIIYV